MTSSNPPAYSPGAVRRPHLLLTMLAVFLTRALFLPPTLEDIDSVNFALALERFDPRLHQPHPPGYPVYVALARLVHLGVPDPARALALLSALAQAAIVLPLGWLMLRFSASRGEAVAATLITLFNPLFWFNGARPLSDSVGLLFVLAAQAFLIAGIEKPRALIAGAALSGIAMGVRFQAGLLTLPLWLYCLFRAREGRRAALFALPVAIFLWGIPLVSLSGGPEAYLEAVGGTLEDALPVEPLVATFTVNRAAKAAFQGLVSPWVSAPLGLGVTLLSALGFLLLVRERRPPLGLALLCFAPYLILHLLFQQVSVLRYSLPYVPLVSWLAVSGLKRPRLQGAVTLIVLLWSSALSFPALLQYHKEPSPPYAALRAVEAAAKPRESFVLSGHYMFNRYFGLKPEKVEFLRPTPKKELAGLEAFWLSGGTKTVLFLAHPDRTDLELIAPKARRLLGRWEYSSSVLRFLSGARPTRAELVAIDRPVWFAGPGWMISDEAGSIADVTRVEERTIHVAPLEPRSFVLVSGVPLSPEAERFKVDLRLGGTPLESLSLGKALLESFVVPPAAAQDGFELFAATTRPGGAPFLFTGFDYGPEQAAGFVHGEGWFLPERDEDLRPFRWTAPSARSLLHVPVSGALLRIEGIAPLEYLQPGVAVEVRVAGASRASSVLRERPFHFEIELTEPGFVELVVRSDRSFMPDLFQKNGDRRELALRVYRFELVPRGAARE